MNVSAKTATIHPLALVQSDCEVGDTSIIWQFASVIRRCKIGRCVTIGASSVLDGCEVGNGSVICSHAFIPPGIRIGENCFIGPGVKFCNDPWPRVTKEGWHDLEDLISGKVVITSVESCASLGAGVMVMPGVMIGRWAMIAAGAVVTKNVPDMMLHTRGGLLQEIDLARVCADNYRQRFVARSDEHAARCLLPVGQERQE